MRAVNETRRSPLLYAVLGIVAVALVASWPIRPARAADARLEQAQQQRAEVQGRLDALLARLDEVEANANATEARLAELRAQEQAQQAQAEAATDSLAVRIRETYKRGNVDPALSLFSSSSPQEASRQARMLTLLALRSRAEYEGASAARIRTVVTAGEVTRVAEELDARQQELDKVRGEVAAELAKAQQEEKRIRTVLAREEARRRAAAERAARANPGRPSRGAVPAAQVVGDVACPVGNPRSYSDTWGAPRSGGRRHQGTDIMSPRGTAIYAYETGTITRLTNSRLGGISVYMRGVSGNLYYYTHLRGYVSGLRSGQRVTIGEHIAYNGDTGNARGIPHLHFEVMPGGGRNVNPYPFVRRACG